MTHRPAIVSTMALLIGMAVAACGGTSSNGPDRSPSPTATTTTVPVPTTGSPSDAARPTGSAAGSSSSAVLRVSPWTSEPLEVDHNPSGTPRLVSVNSAHHDEPGLAYDRLVFTFDGGIPGYHIRYVPEVRSPGEGSVVPLRGQAFIEVTFSPAAAHGENGATSLRTGSSGGGYPGLVDYRMAGDFEGYVHFGLGIDDRVALRVLELANPERIAVDISA